MTKNQTNSNAPYDPFAAETITIHADWWPEGWQVVVRELSYAETQRLGTAAMKVGRRLPKTKKEGKQQAENLTYDDMDLERLKCMTMLAAIESWTLPDGNGGVMPLNETSIRRLRAKDGEFIEEAIGALNPDRDEEFQNGSAVDPGTGEGTVAS